MSEQSKERYKVVFRGELVENLSREAVEENFRQRLKFSDAMLAKIFSGKAMILKSDLDRQTADRYARALWQAGARCVVAPMIEPLLEPVLRPPAPEPRMTCPKCGQEQPEGEICIGCGVVIAKYRQRLEEPSAPPSSPAPAVEPPPTGEESPGVARALAGTQPWVKLVSILMFVGSGIGLAGAVFTMTLGARRGLPGSTAMALVQMLLCLIYLFPASLLFRYGGAINTFLLEGKTSDLETALERQRSFWKFVGVLALIAVVLAVVGILAAILIPAYIFSGH